jgi:hypothetical protein
MSTSYCLYLLVVLPLWVSAAVGEGGRRTLQPAGARRDVSHQPPSKESQTTVLVLELLAGTTGSTTGTKLKIVPASTSTYYYCARTAALSSRLVVVQAATISLQTTGTKC